MRPDIIYYIMSRTLVCGNSPTRMLFFIIRIRIIII